MARRQRLLKTTRIIKGIAEIADGYDGFLIDQWGVLHNGHWAHPGSLEALRHLKKNKPVVLLSNSSRPPQASAKMLEELGFMPNDYDAVVTSGGLTRDYLREALKKFGERVKVFDDSGVPSDLLEGLQYTEVETVQEADFLLMARTEADDLSDYMDDLRGAHKRGLPMVCGNPDKVSVAPDGHLRICPGAVAEAYGELGGEVIIFGKPQAAIYAEAFALMEKNLGRDFDKGRILAVGDSLEHDIDGGNRAGCDSLLIAGGIHRHALLPNGEAFLTEATLAAFQSENSIHADYVCESFRL